MSAPALATGRTMLDAIRDGVVPPPPAAAVLNLDLRVVDDGRTVFGFHPAAEFGNGSGAIHGGILAGVADFGVTTAIMTTLPADAGLVTSNLNVTYVRPVLADDDALECESRVIHVGRTLAHAETVIRGATGAVVLRATATCHVRHPDRR